MATAPQTVCRTPCCPGYAVERGYCEPCAKLDPKKKDDNRRHKIALQRSKEEIAFYQTSEWRYTAPPTAIAYNAQCQFLVNGVQCSQPSKFVHHKVSPRVTWAKGTALATLPVCSYITTLPPPATTQRIHDLTCRHAGVMDLGYQSQNTNTNSRSNLAEYRPKERK